MDREMKEEEDGEEEGEWEEEAGMEDKIPIRYFRISSTILSESLMSFPAQDSWVACNF